MRVNLFTFVMASFLMTSACGNASSDGADDETTTGTGGATAEGTDTDTTGGDDAASVDNEAVKDKPLLKSCYKGDSFVCQVEATIVSETNLVRGTRKALIQDFESAFVARSWSTEQAAAGNISHDGFPYERKKVLVAEFPNASWGFFAENVAMMSSHDSDPVVVGKKFVEMWKNSSGHLTNMLGNYSYLGAGVARVGNNIYATQIFH